MKRIMTSSWSVHRTLGQVMYDWSDMNSPPVRAREQEAGGMELLDLPRNLAERDIGMLEIGRAHV